MPLVRPGGGNYHLRKEAPTDNRPHLVLLRRYHASYYAILLFASEADSKLSVCHCQELRLQVLI
jgi:hypothetical protein